jgi:predicted permease
LPSSLLAPRIDALAANPESMTSPQVRRVTSAPVARLRDGVSPEQAGAELTARVRALAAADPAFSYLADRSAVRVEPLQAGLFQSYRTYLWLIVAAVSLVLLAACVNLSILLTARGRSRERDVAVRSALGASPARLVGAAAIEATVLCIVGGLVAWLLLLATHDVVTAAVPARFKPLAATLVDTRVVMAALGAALLAALVAGVGPSLQLVRLDVLRLLQRGMPSTGGALRGGTTLLIVEAALGTLLVAAAIVSVQNIIGLAYRSPGYVANGLYAFSSSARYSQMSEPDRLRAYLDAIRDVPGVAAAGASLGSQPVGGQLSTVTRGFWDVRNRQGGDWAVSAGLIEALQARLIAGRPLTQDDVDGRGSVAVLTESAVRALWPDVEPRAAVGRFFDYTDGLRSVVGVIGDIRARPGDPIRPALFVPVPAPARPSSSNIHVLFRMAPGVIPDPRAVSAKFRERLGQGVSLVYIPHTLDPWLEQPRFQTWLFAALAALAVALTAIGIYAVSSFEVFLRRREMGVRVALGASSSRIRLLLLGRVLLPVLAGTGLGCCAGWWASQFLQSLVFEVDARAPQVFVAVAAVLVLTACVGAWMPVRRAARTGPAEVLRSA